LEQAAGLHQAGRLAEAAEIYKEIIAQTPRHFDATHLLGVIALQEGRYEEAQQLIEAALNVDPKHAGALSNLGTAHLRSGEPKLAHAHFERAVKLQPNSSSALTNLGAVLRQLGRSREALGPLRRAYSRDPKSAELCNLLGACLLDTADAQEAVKFFEAATRAAPDAAEGWTNLAVALNQLGERERAQECADRAIEMRPDSSDALAARAAVEFEQGEIDAAIVTYQQAVALPNPSSLTYCAFGNALWTAGRGEEALEQLRQSISVDPDNVMARWKLAVSTCRTFYDTEAEIDRSRAAFAESLGELHTWFHAAHRPEAYTAVGSTQPFFIAYQPFNNKEILARYGRLCCDWMTTMPLDVSDARRKPPTDRKLRIGIASAQIREHSVWNAIGKGWVDHLDKARFEIWLFDLGRDSDTETARARSSVAHFEDRPKDLLGWVKAIGSAKLDAMIYPEIGMDALTAQLASLRLAPVQATSWGHPETSGLPTMDLYISADAFEPADAEGNYSERLVRLPNCGVCVEPLAPAIEGPNLQSLGLPSDEPLLLCPGTPYKYSPVHDRVWARIAKGLQPSRGKQGWARIASRLRGGSNGRLVFFRNGNETTMDNFLAQRLRRAFDAEKIDFDAHVCSIPYLKRPQFYGLMQQAALMLDTVGFSGFNTALQAIEAGLPVLARESAFMRGRLASGIMRRLDLPELVAGSDEAFIETAIALAANPSRLAQLRVEIENRRHILYHDVEPVRALERCLTEAIGQSWSERG
jgi:predicted O-linked N-acetylglucosamine transferase (SPINDLY family)